VLADPGGCVSTYGTRDDFLIPSACLNSTVSGLISRTVLRADLTGPDDFHGAKFYRELAGADVSGLFLDTVTDAFDRVATPSRGRSSRCWHRDRSPTWRAGRRFERISAEYGINDVNLVKPGVGETTRVLPAPGAVKISRSAARAPTWTTYACWPRSAASRSRRWTGCRHCRWPFGVPGWISPTQEYGSPSTSSTGRRAARPAGVRGPGRCPRRAARGSSTAPGAAAPGLVSPTPA